MNQQNSTNNLSTNSPSIPTNGLTGSVEKKILANRIRLLPYGKGQKAKPRVNFKV